ncbi:H(+)/Cl(-) exchange transporter ClcA [Fimbriimonas ginsengisoli]|uniref:Chloride channel core n=1 Tax=Fimbriimonas ginsengisoli Gsoil 348 TaxID=661478 RepID=A0A068NWD0_FIMGI|nr:H(+)/Cl(-) exchange transporter ClcA [Fimbriimonas ginsengisoli]AIE85914.1 Chloride channel core [Fimbriimonas ginsengisoli Gsoil 348]
MSSARAEREKVRHSLHRGLLRINLLHSAAVGFIAGLIGVCYQFSVRLVEAWSHRAAAWSALHGSAGIFLWVAGAALFSAGIALMIGRFAPDSGGSGIPHIKSALLHLRVIRPVRLLVAKFLGGLGALATGMSLGREGPTIQMGAAVGKLFGDKMRVPRRARSALVAAGAGAGLASAFNAPLAGFLFVMEELKREMSALTYGSALIASVSAVAVTRYLVGERPSFVLPSPGGAPLSVLPLTACLGLLAGVGGVLFNRVLIAGLEIRRVRKLPVAVVGAVAGALAALALVYLPKVAGGGHQVAERLLAGEYQGITISAILALFLAKLLLTAISYATGLPGGIFAPILVMGAFLGYAFGIGAHALWPSVPFSAGGFATVGMAAMLSASVRAPLTGVVLIVEMTAEYGLLYALLISAFAASLVAQALRDEPIYEALMERDLRLSGAEVHPEEEPILVELLVEPHSGMDGRRISRLGLPVGAIVVTLERGSTHIVPGGSTLLMAGDMLTIMIQGDRPELSLEIHEAARAPD